MSDPVDTIHVWIDDSHAVVRRGMSAALTPLGMVIVGESSRLTPVPDLSAVDVLVFESEGNGLRTALAAGEGRDVRLVATVRLPGPARLQQLTESGVAAVLLHEDLTPEHLANTVRAVATGRAPATADTLPRLLDRAARLAHAGPGTLNAREREVLRMLAQGEDTRGIALQLCYSERTVKNVVHDVLTKLNCRTRAQAVGIATRAGVI
ncbi:MAG: response regulator transcription factor [Actinomycetales bacterium]|nr:response regulator transcription factor [Actinomycetales bacterium]